MNQRGRIHSRSTSVPTSLSYNSLLVSLLKRFWELFVKTRGPFNLDFSIDSVIQTSFPFLLLSYCYITISKWKETRLLYDDKA